MIVGQRNVGKKLITLAITVVVAMIVISALVGLRKKTAPANEPRLHSSTPVVLLPQIR